MNPERIEALVAASTSAQAARRLAVSAPTYYPSKQGAAAPAAPLMRAGTTRAHAAHAIDIDLHG